MFKDERGILYFPVKNNNFSVKETVVSVNRKDVFRGIHLEQFSKLIMCLQGSIIDIIINFDESSNDFLVPKYYHLTANAEENQIIVPPNCGHAFLSLEDNTIILYHFSETYDNKKTKNYNYMDPVFNIKLPISTPIISEKDLNSPFYKKTDFYVLGGNGFIGSVICDSIIKSNSTFYKTCLRLEEVSKLEEELKLYKPKYVICSAGITGTPNISWCETNKTETIKVNITYQMTLADICKNNNIHLTIIGSGAIFKNDKYYTEDDNGNYDSNFYGKCRIYLENMVKNYENVLYVRINYPISKNISNKNLITKLLSYSSIDNVYITLSYIDELVPYLIDMITKYEIGVCNLVNDGSINLLDIINIYEQETNKPTCKLKNNDSIKKSTSLLQIGKIKQYNVMKTEDAVRDCIKKYIL